MVSFEFARGLFVHGRTPGDGPKFLAKFIALEITEAQVYCAARIAADLQKTGQPIGLCDVWIASAALQEKMPILTSNHRHFDRIEGVQTLAYSIA